MKSAIKNGIVKKQKENQFQEFHIADMYKNLSHCPNCCNGVRCPKHKLVRKTVKTKINFYN